MEMSDLILSDEGPLSKVRRFSVHDTQPDDNQVVYGQPDGLMMSDGPTRIAAVHDAVSSLDEVAKTRSLHSARSSGDDDGGGDALFIADTVDNNEEYATEQLATPSFGVDDARHSVEQSPMDSDGAKQKEEYFDAAHYRHPSLAKSEQPIHDDDDGEKDHNRFASVIRHDVAVSDSEYEETPYDENSEHQLAGRKISRLHDYWCHGSSGIAIEDDTDAKVLREKHSLGFVQAHSVKKGSSMHEINHYTRPMMSKVVDNGHWDSVYGHGIISDSHSKYKSHRNGQFIEWILEISDINGTANTLGKRTIVIGLSSDLDGSLSTKDHFAAIPSGMGFNNLGEILVEDEPFRKEKDLQFGTREAVHLILDYSDSVRWRLYSKVGDLDEEDYDDLSKAEDAGKLIAVFDRVPPGSYRLAVSLFSSMDALIIEHCRIHGVDDAEFHQELKQYALTEEAEEEEQVEVVPVDPQNEAVNDTQRLTVVEKPTETTTLTDGKEMESEEDDAVETPEKEETKKEEIETTETPQKDIAADSLDDTDSAVPPWPSNTAGAATVVFKPTVNGNEVSPSPNMLSPNQEEEAVVDERGDNDGRDGTKQPMDSLETSKSVEIHTPKTPDTVDSTVSPMAKEVETERLEQQSKLIDLLRQQIAELKRENENKQREINDAAERERGHKESIQSMQSQMASLRAESGAAEEKRSSMEEENQRLCHELNLAEERAESLDTAQQELRERLKNVIESKLQLIKSTSEEIDHYRKLIQQIAQNKLGCQLLSDFAKSAHGLHDEHSGYRYNGRRPMRPQNGYY